jgi:hypothetical protein
MDEIEWRREDETLTPEQRDVCVDEFIELLLTLDSLLQAQAAADAAYFLRLCERNFTPAEQRAIRSTMLRAYRWQYIASGIEHPSFRELLAQVASDAQIGRIDGAMRPIVA